MKVSSGIRENGPLALRTLETGGGFGGSLPASIGRSEKKRLAQLKDIA
jgi:hypothetical protein